MLLDRYRKGDDLAAEEIWQRYASRLKILADHRLLPSLARKTDADDILQTTFFEFFQKAKRNEVHWQERGDLWRLLASIAIHHVGRQAEHYRAAKRDLSREANLTNQIMGSVNDEEIAMKMEQLIEPFLNDDSMLAAIVGGRLAGKTIVEVADETGKSERTIRRKLEQVKLALVADSAICTGLELPVANEEFRSAEYANYDLLKMIGAGGFGKVYLARDRVADRVVAIKALRRDWIGNTTAESLFLNEATTIARLNHPNIVRFHKIGPLPNGSWFMVLDYVRGERLDAIDMNNCGQQLILRWILQVGEAVAYLHSQNVVHGDLKPANVLIEGDDARMIDFGFSRQSNNNDPVWYGGTHGFAAPERQTTSMADVFAFGRVIEFICDGANCLNGSIQRGLSDIVRDSRADDPKSRPACEELVVRIEELANEDE